MEAVLKNLSNTAELLAVSQTDFVSDWDDQTVARAFRWARYCERVCARSYANPSARSALEGCLHATNLRLAQTLAPYRCVTLSDVAQCRRTLFVGLLKNPAVPLHVVRSLFEKFGDVGSADEHGATDWDVASVIRCRSACEVLGSLTVQRHESLGLSLGSQVQGEMLLQRIKEVQCRPDSDSWARTLLDGVIQDDGGSGDLSQVIAAGLLLGCSEDAGDFLLDWLQRHCDFLQSMCQTLQPALCTKLSQECPKFKRIYWDNLKKWASSLEFSVCEQVWVQQCSSAMSFTSLVDRVKSLWSSGSLLKEETEKDLEVLKQADGDFEVQGLSVWTDLLINLK
ncbi:Fanconi anemia group F protein [Brachyhypopomus gauderio]|uniref:Fanconi anemia group F protein n=1 Tax=Brachyhypopomus gauderio TaxID=698409 RepID=UPI0040416CDD